MNTIFISYRREESAGHAGRIYDRLREKFGRDSVFMDVAAIEPGVDFVEAIDRAVGSCAALLVVIGQRWLECTDASGRPRLDNPRDFIRLEVATALRRNIRVIPVLVQDAAMPREDVLPEDLKPLARRNAIEINDTHWDSNLGQLIGTLEQILGSGPVPDPVGKDKDKDGKKSRRFLLIGAVAAVGAIVLAVLLSGIVPGRQTQSVTVPNVVGQPLDRAVRMLIDAGLQPGTRTERVVDVGRAQPGTVIDQRTKGGSQVKRGTAVDLLVAVQQPVQEQAGNIIARGRLEIPQTYAFDLDQGRVIRNGDEDFWFQAVTGMERYLTPQNGAIVGLTRDIDQKCHRVLMKRDRIAIEQLQTNTWACFRTSHGRRGALRLTEPVGPSPGVLRIEYLIWE